MFNHTPEDKEQTGPGKSHHQQMLASQAAEVTRPLFSIANDGSLG